MFNIRYDIDSASRRMNTQISQLVNRRVLAEDETSTAISRSLLECKEEYNKIKTIKNPDSETVYLMKLLLDRIEELTTDRTARNSKIPSPLHRGLSVDFLNKVTNKITKPLISNFIAQLKDKNENQIVGTQGSYDLAAFEELFINRPDLFTEQIIHSVFSLSFKNTKKESGLTLSYCDSFIKKYGNSRNGKNTIVRMMKDIPLFSLRSGKWRDNYAERVAINPLLALSVLSLFVQSELNGEKVIEVNEENINTDHIDPSKVLLLSHLTRIDLSKLKGDLNIPSSVLEAFNNIYKVLGINFSVNKIDINTLDSIIEFNNNFELSERVVSNMFTRFKETYCNISFIQEFIKTPDAYGVNSEKTPVISGSKTGRMFIKNGLQMAPNILKQSAYIDMLHAKNYDIKDSQVYFLYHILYDYQNMTGKDTTKYKNKIRTYISTGKEEYARGLGLSKKTFKKMIYSTLFGSNPKNTHSSVFNLIKDEIVDYNKSLEILRKFNDEVDIIQVTEYVSTIINEYHELKSSDKYPNKLCKFISNSKNKAQMLSYYSQGYESFYILEIIKELLYKGELVYSYEFDGFVSQCYVSDKLMRDIFIKHFNDELVAIVETKQFTDDRLEYEEMVKLLPNN